MLLPLVRSWKHPYVNLQNQITIWTRFAHLKYKPEVNQRIWPLHCVFSIPEISEELYSPYSAYTMDQTQERRLKEYYATERSIRVNAIGVSF